MIKAIVISGPSGVGKTTIIKKLLEDEKLKNKLLFSVSYTTREKRANEIEGKDYFFVSKEKFLRLIESGEMLEWAEVHGNMYGTPKANLYEALRQNRILLLDVDVQGAEAIKQKIGKECILIFIKPPSIKELKRRITQRKDTKDIERRIKKAKEEIEKSNIFDFVVLNDDLEKATEEIRKIIEGVIKKAEQPNNSNFK